MSFARPSAMAAGLLMGLAAVGASIPGLRMAGGEGTLGLDLRITTKVTPEVGLKGDPLIVNARRLMPRTAHNGARGAGTIVNQTAVPLRINVITQPSTPQTADDMMIELFAGKRRFARGTVAQLRTGRHGSFVLPHLGRRRLRVHAWLPASTGRSYRGVLQDLGLQVQVTPIFKGRTP